MAKVKMSKEESGSQDFVEKRRAALERSELHNLSLSCMLSGTNRKLV